MNSYNSVQLNRLVNSLSCLLQVEEIHLIGEQALGYFEDSRPVVLVLVSSNNLNDNDVLFINNLYNFYSTRYKDIDFIFMSIVDFRQRYDLQYIVDFNGIELFSRSTMFDEYYFNESSNLLNLSVSEARLRMAEFKFNRAIYYKKLDKLQYANQHYYYSIYNSLSSMISYCTQRSDYISHADILSTFKNLVLVNISSVQIHDIELRFNFSQSLRLVLDYHTGDSLEIEDTNLIHEISSEFYKLADTYIHSNQLDISYSYRPNIFSGLSQAVIRNRLLEFTQELNRLQLPNRIRQIKIPAAEINYNKRLAPLSGRKLDESFVINQQYGVFEELFLKYVKRIHCFDKHSVVYFVNDIMNLNCLEFIVISDVLDDNKLEKLLPVKLFNRDVYVIVVKTNQLDQYKLVLNESILLDETLRLVNARNTLSNYMKMSKECLDFANQWFNENDFVGTSNRSYYSVLYALVALSVYIYNKEPSRTSDVIDHFNELFAEYDNQHLRMISSTLQRNIRKVRQTRIHTEYRSHLPINLQNVRRSLSTAKEVYHVVSEYVI